MNETIAKSYIYVPILIPTIKREVINVTKTDVDLHQTKLVTQTKLIVEYMQSNEKQKVLYKTSLSLFLSPSLSKHVINLCNMYCLEMYR